MGAMPSDAARCVKLPRSLSQLPDANGSPKSPSDAPGGDDAVSGAGFSYHHHRRFSSFSYVRLPTDPLLRLSVLKLDGSSFDVFVGRSASVGELKKAIEDLFSQPSEDESCVISWSHVWGHFSLCYNDHRLMEDKLSLQTFGIKDGDQLNFVRHISLNHGPREEKSKNHGTDSEQHRRSFSGAKVHADVEEKDKDMDSNGVRSGKFVDEHDACEYDDGEVGQIDYKLGRLFHGWFHYSKLKTSEGTKS